MIGHEVRTPLNMLLGTTQLLRTDRSEAAVQEGLDDIERSARRLLGMINELLLIAAAGGGGGEEPVDVRANASQWMRRSTGEGPPVTIAGNVPRQVLVNAAALSQLGRRTLQAAAEEARHEGAERWAARLDFDGEHLRLDVTFRESAHVAEVMKDARSSRIVALARTVGGRFERRGEATVCVELPATMAAATVQIGLAETLALIVGRGPRVDAIERALDGRVGERLRCDGPGAAIDHLRRLRGLPTLVFIAGRDGPPGRPEDLSVLLRANPAAQLVGPAGTPGTTVTFEPSASAQEIVLAGLAAAAEAGLAHGAPRPPVSEIVVG